MYVYHKFLKCSECVDDFSWLCPSLADMCTVDIEYMKQNCAKTCGFCGNAGWLLFTFFLAKFLNKRFWKFKQNSYRYWLNFHSILYYKLIKKSCMWNVMPKLFREKKVVLSNKSIFYKTYKNKQLNKQKLVLKFKKLIKKC